MPRGIAAVCVYLVVGFGVSLLAGGGRPALASPRDQMAAGGFSTLPAGREARGFGVRDSVQIDPFIQQGAKLLASGGHNPETDNAGQGWSVALSGDGSTALIGDVTDNQSHGAAWVFVRSGNAWVQQGPKLVGRGTTDGAFVGWSVALSGNGRTALIGAPGQDDGDGAAWVFVRSGNTWVQQGHELVGRGVAADNFGTALGSSVALSADGNTALIGGPGNEDDPQGATWVFVRAGTRWSQQGPSLVGSGTAGGENDGQGSSVALSADGNTALIGAPDDGRIAATDRPIGATWVFVRSGTAWSQQGPKLVGSTAGLGQNGSAQGGSVALSSDGNTALVGAAFDGDNQGATWVFVRSRSRWSQQGPKLVGAGTVGFSGQGVAVALSGDGKTALVGGAMDGDGRGATWVFARHGSSWSQEGSKLLGTGAQHPDLDNPGQGSSVALSRAGNTALIGGPNDNDDQGATWVFVRASTVKTSHTFTVSHIRTYVDGTVSLRAKASEPGRIDVLETAWNDNLARGAALLQPAPRRFVYARKQSRISGGRPGTITINPVGADGSWSHITATQ